MSERRGTDTVLGCLCAGDRVLPLKSYLDWKLGRFGRGLTLAAAFWGGLWTIDTVEVMPPPGRWPAGKCMCPGY